MKKAWKWASFSLLLLLALAACQREAAPSPIPTPLASPTPSPAAEPTPVPTESPEADRTLPALFAENERWMVYLDDWVYTEVDGSVMDLSVYEKDGTLYQKLRSCSHYTGPHPWNYLNYDRIAPPVLLTDLNFDGMDDIRVDYETIRCGAYAAFLWDEEEERFIEEPTFSQIKRPYPMDGIVWGCCSSGASNTNFSAYSYSREAGYQLLRFLNVDTIYLSDGEYGVLYTEDRYENGELVDTVETEEDLTQSDFWKDYVEYTYQNIWG